MDTTVQAPFLRGTKTVLRPLNKATDLELVWQWANDPEVNRYLSRNFPMSREQEEGWFDGLAARKDDIILAMTTLDGRLVGTTGLHRISWVDRTATTGTMIGDVASWGQGFGTDAKMLLLRYAFERLNLRRIYSYVFADNERSRRCQLRCGYQEEVRYKESRFRDGRYVDEIGLVVTYETWLPAWQAYQAKQP